MAVLLEDYQTNVLSIMSQGEKLLRDMSHTVLAEEITSQIQEFMGKDKPSIMFYGLYNAGKSTLINALCRESVAKVGDIPTTASIQGIPYQGYQLVDTPGIDAKQDHTEIARKEILQSDLILFVVDNADGFERQVVYKSIIEIVKMQKPVAVVINQKNINEDEDIDLDVPELPSMQRTVAKIASNLQRQGMIENCDLLQEKKFFLGYFPLNAQMCLDALECGNAEDLETLYTGSGIFSLIHAMDKSIAETGTVLRLRTPLIHLKEKLEEGFRSYSETDIFGDQAVAAKELNILMESKQRSYEKLISQGYLKIESCFEKVISVGSSGNYNGLTEQLQQELRSLLEESGATEHKFLCRQLGALNDYNDGNSAFTSGSASENELGNALTTIGDIGLLTPPIIAPIPSPIPPTIIIKLVAVACSVLGRILTSKGGQNSGDEARARESEERLAAYYKWKNDLRDTENKIKLDFQSAVDKFIEHFYGQRLQVLDDTLSKINETCTQYTIHQKELEELNRNITLLLNKLALDAC